MNDVANNNIAEMLAIEFAVIEVLAKFPSLSGIFINSDSMNSVHQFWAFKNPKEHSIMTPIKDNVLKIIGDRWIKVKHVKAHTGNKDKRSRLNHKVDKLSKSKN